MSGKRIFLKGRIVGCCHQVQIILGSPRLTPSLEPKQMRSWGRTERRPRQGALQKCNGGACFSAYIKMNWGRKKGPKKRGSTPKGVTKKVKRFNATLI